MCQDVNINFYITVNNDKELYNFKKYHHIGNNKIKMLNQFKRQAILKFN